MSDAAAASETTPAVTRERVIAAVGSLRELPASVVAVQRALAQLDYPEFVVADVKKTLLSDAAIAARVLRLANSAYFGFRSEVQTISQAIVLLGPQRIRTLLLRILADKAIAEIAGGRAAALPIRKMSLATATAACTLSQLLLREDAEEVLLAGLLHNIGDLLLLARFPAEYSRACELAQALGHSRAEEEIFGINCGQAGRRLLEHWHFPRLYTIVVEYIDQPLAPDYPPELHVAVALAHTGKKLAEALLAGQTAAEATARVTPEIAQLLGLDAALLAEVYETLPQRMSLEQLQAGRV